MKTEQKIEDIRFNSSLAPYMTQLLAEKTALGYSYVGQAFLLRQLDQFIVETGDGETTLTKEVVNRWIAIRPHESAGTQWSRVHIIRQLGLLMLREGIPAYLPDRRLVHPESEDYFIPYIFSHEELRRFFHSADSLQLLPHSISRQRHLMMPMLFRLFYGCGLRMNEALNLRRRDVDIENGALCIRQAKFRKDRLVPMADGLTERMNYYLNETVPNLSADDYIFPSPIGGPYSNGAIYHIYRDLLRHSGISHGGRGVGPRLHDLRHTFAVHCLQRWVRSGVDLTAALPLLATYLGHTKLTGTQQYLRLTAELYPDIVSAVEAQCGQVIPEL